MLDFKNPDLCKVRTITAFLSLDKNTEKWGPILQKTAEKLGKLAEEYKDKNYEVQTIRIVTNPFGEYLDTTSLENALNGMKELSEILKSDLMPDIRIRFAIGAAKNKAELKLLPEMIKNFGDICNCCINIPADNLGMVNNDLCLEAAQVIKKLGDITPHGEGNFNFSANFNCAPLIPYFPPSYFDPNDTVANHNLENQVFTQDCFAIGFETPDLLVHILKKVRAKNITNRNQFLQESFKELSIGLQFHVDLLANIAKEFSTKEDYHFVGVDSSAAPNPGCSPMTDLYELLGVDFFGASGTLEVSSFLTHVFKSVRNVPLIGFSGLMLSATEDLGLSSGTIAKNYDLRTLLMNSAVCGIGLDTVPIPGDVSVQKIAEIMRDTGTLAFRLKKPLMVRLFPVENLKAGDMTNFTSSDLCNCAVLEVK